MNGWCFLLPPEPRRASAAALGLQSRTLRVTQTWCHDFLIMCDLGQGISLSEPQFPSSVKLALAPSCIVWLP